MCEAKYFNLYLFYFYFSSVILSGSLWIRHPWLSFEKSLRVKFTIIESYKDLWNIKDQKCNFETNLARHLHHWKSIFGISTFCYKKKERRFILGAPFFKNYKLFCNQEYITWSIDLVLFISSWGLTNQLILKNKVL